MVVSESGLKISTEIRRWLKWQFLVPSLISTLLEALALGWLRIEFSWKVNVDLSKLE